jgi:hypothetical protein
MLQQHGWRPAGQRPSHPTPENIQEVAGTMLTVRAVQQGTKDAGCLHRH